MNGKLQMVACALAVTLMLSITGCAGGGSSQAKIISGGYVPGEITNIEGGGEFDASSLTPHDSSELSLEKLEGLWVYDSLADGNKSGGTNNSGPVVVTDKVFTLNEKKVECLPKSIDIRPYSPLGSLLSEGFGYGAAVFTDAAESNGTRIEAIQPTAALPYGRDGFICTINGSTLALGLLGADAKMDEYGVVIDKEKAALNECKLTEIDYEASLEGDRLTLSYDGVSAVYVQEPVTMYPLHSGKWNGDPLYESNNPVGLLGSSAKDLLNKGYSFDCNMDELLPTCGLSKEVTVKTPGGSTLSAKLVNPYEKSVPVGFSKVCWYEYGKGKAGKLTVGRPSSYGQNNLSLEFGVTPYADVYNRYELPYEASEDCLCYKTGYNPLSKITPLGDGYDTGKTMLETEHSCEIRLNFDNNALSSVSVGDPIYLNAGLQDNVAHDDLDSLTPSVYREATEQRDRILDKLKKSFQAAGVKAVVNERTGEVAMDSNVLFDVDSYEISDAGKKYIDGVFEAYASVVLSDEFSGSVKGIVFEGHTDSDGDDLHNKLLSQNRADAVKEYCRGTLDDNAAGLFDSLATSEGFGFSDLVYDKNGKEDKGASRRVAIKFMLNVDDLKSEAGSQGGGGSASGASAPSSSPAASDSASSSTDAKDGSGEPAKFRSISKKFDQGWALYEQAGGDGVEHLAMLLLSKDHLHCAYFDLTQDSSSAKGHYTFGEASVEDKGSNMQTITVRHGGDEDKLDVIFNAWGKDNMVSVKDPWGGANDLTAVDDVGAATSAFEGILPE